MEVFLEYALTTSKFAVIILSILILARCLRSMLSEKYESEVWGHLGCEGDSYTLTHWENLIGRSISSDVRLCYPGVSRCHAVLSRNDKGIWKIYDIFSRSGVWVNGVKVGGSGSLVEAGDVHIDRRDLHRGESPLQVGESLPERSLDVGDGVVAGDRVAVKPLQGRLRVETYRLPRESRHLRVAHVQHRLPEDVQHLGVAGLQGQESGGVARLDREEKLLVEPVDSYGDRG